MSEDSVLRARNRRALLGAMLAGAAAAIAPRASAAGTVRFGTTPVFLDDQIALLGLWRYDLEQRLKRPVQFVQRGSYREIVDLMLADQLDVAWICGYPFVANQAQLSLVAVPTYQGAPLYRSYLIVPERDATTQSIGDLRGRVFAFSDPLSNSGYLVPRFELLRQNTVPAQFFRRSFFTFAHRKVVEAVQVGLADGGSVDGYVWDTLVKQKPAATAGVRVAWRSPLFGFPPVAARATLPPGDRAAIADALVGMTQSPTGREVLLRLNIDGFERGDALLFDGIREMARAADHSGKDARA